MNQYVPDRVPRLRSADAPGPRQPNHIELLTDLAIVVILSHLVRRLSHDPSVAALGYLLLLLVPVWWLWNGLAFYANRFVTDNDRVELLFTCLELLALLVMGAVIEQALKSRPATLLFVGIYAVLRALVLGKYQRAGSYVPTARPFTVHVQVGIGLGLLGWAGAMLAPAPFSYYLWALALATELLAPLVAGGQALHQNCPPDARHLPGRVATFTTLVLAQVASSIVLGVGQAGLGADEIGRGLLAGTTLLGLWAAYFGFQYQAPVQALSERQRTGPFWVWIYLHLLLTVLLLLTGVGLSLAIDQQSGVALTEWLLGGGAGGSLLCAGCLGLLTQWASDSPPVPGDQRRVVVRLLAGSVLLVATPWTSPLALLYLGAAAGLLILLLDHLGPTPPPRPVPTVASRLSWSTGTVAPPANPTGVYHSTH